MIVNLFTRRKRSVGLLFNRIRQRRIRFSKKLRGIRPKNPNGNLSFPSAEDRNINSQQRHEACFVRSERSSLRNGYSFNCPLRNITQIGGESGGPSNCLELCSREEIEDFSERGVSPLRFGFIFFC